VYQFTHVEIAPGTEFSGFLDPGHAANDAITAFQVLLDWLDYFFNNRACGRIFDYMMAVDRTYGEDLLGGANGNRDMQCTLIVKYYRYLFSAVFDQREEELATLWSRIFLCYPNPTIVDRLLIAILLKRQPVFYEADPSDRDSVTCNNKWVKEGNADLHYPPVNPSLDEMLTSASSLSGPAFWAEHHAGLGQGEFDAQCQARSEDWIAWKLGAVLSHWGDREQADLAAEVALLHQVALNALPQFATERQ
jgi:hypothetical protein